MSIHTHNLNRKPDKGIYTEGTQECLFWLEQKLNGLRQAVTTQWGQACSIKSVLIPFIQRGIKLTLKTDESSSQCIM